MILFYVCVEQPCETSAKTGAAYPMQLWRCHAQQSEVKQHVLQST